MAQTQFTAEPDDDIEGQYVVAEVNPGDFDRDGSVAGYTTGPQARECAELVAAHMTQTGRAPAPEHAAELNFTPRDDWRPA